MPALLALHSLQYGYSPEADSALLNALKRGFTRQIYAGHTDLIWDADFTPDGKYIATASNDATARLWDVQTGQEIRRFTPPVRIVNAVEFSPDGRYLLTGNPGPTTWLWDVQTGQPVREFTGSTAGTWEVRFSPDGRYAITGDDGMSRVWDVQTGKQKYELNAHTNAPLNGIIGVAFSPNGQEIATGELDGTIHIWSVATGEDLRHFSSDGNSAYLRYSPDGKTLVSTSDKVVQLFDSKTGQEIHRLLGHTDLAIWAAFSADGHLLASASFDKTVRLWDVATGQELHTFIGHTGPVNTVIFSPDGHYILSAGGDRTAGFGASQPQPSPFSLTQLTGARELLRLRRPPPFRPIVNMC